jgi:hypothetical protein
MRGLFRFAAAALLGFVLGGCSLASQIGTTNPTGIAQQLLVRSLERALGSLDLDRLRGRPVGLEVAVQSGNENFVKDFTATWLRAHGMRVTSDSPEMKLKLFVSVYGTDRDETLIGVPASRRRWSTSRCPSWPSSSGCAIGDRPSCASGPSTARATS